MSFTEPAIAGTTITFRGGQSIAIPASAAQKVAIPLTHDWGPVGADAPGADGKRGGVQEFENFAQWTGLMGDSDTSGRTAVAGAFAGQGLPGAQGAGAVIVYRMAASTVAYAVSAVIVNTAGSPANIFSLQGLYKGTRGNRISYTIDTNPLNVATDRLRIYFDGQLRETYVFTPSALPAFIAAIKNGSQLVTAIQIAGNTSARLAQAVNPVALTGGDDGLGVAAADHIAAQNALQYKDFGLVAPANLTDAPTQASYLSWVQWQASRSRPCRLVLGGGSGDTVAAGIARAALFNDEHVVMLGGGTYQDDLTGHLLTTAQLASRLAGVMASRGELGSATFAELGGLHVVTGPTEDQITAATAGGLVIIMPTTSPDAEVHVQEAVTTYTADTLSKPRDVFGDSRLVGIMDDYVRAMREWGDRTVIGALPVNEDTRAIVRGKARQLEDDLLRRGLILPGDGVRVPVPWVQVDDPNDPSIADTIPYSFGWQFAKTTRAIIGQGSVL